MYGIFAQIKGDVRQQFCVCLYVNICWHWDLIYGKPQLSLLDMSPLRQLQNNNKKPYLQNIEFQVASSIYIVSVSKKRAETNFCVIWKLMRLFKEYIHQNHSLLILAKFLDKHRYIYDTFFHNLGILLMN